MKRMNDLERRIERPLMTVIPQAANHIIITTDFGNAIDVTADPSSANAFYIITKNGTLIKIDKEGNVVDSE